MSAFSSSSSPSSSYIVASFAGRGNGLLAAKNIEAGELIFEDKPISWYRRNVRPEAMCGHCGRYIAHKDTSVACNLKSSEANAEDSCCAQVYCSSACRDLSVRDGHRFLCQTVSGYGVDSLSRDMGEADRLGHFGLAVQVLCLIAERYLASCTGGDSHSRNCPGASSSRAENESDVRLTPEAAGDLVLSGIHSVDYCKCIHAWRTGQIDTDEDMFKNLLRPAYFSSHLEHPHSIARRVLSNASAWGKGNEAYQQEFLSSNVMSGEYFSSLCGIFVSNNLQIKIVGEGLEADSEADGTGIFPIFSKMNHTCDCNTRNQNGAVASVAVYAARPIAEGEEITTSYLHSEPSTMSVRKRGRSLSQYLFRCRCDSCVADREKGGFDSDDVSSSDEEEEEEDEE